MTSPVVTVEMDDTLSEIKHIFDNAAFHHLLVVEGGKLFGIISDRDLFKALSPHIGTAAERNKDLATLNKKAHQILNRKPYTLLPTASLYDAIDIFNESKVSCIPVVNEQQQPVGILSWRDVMKAIGNNRKQ
jgi:acetoin utilization protein AcuB